MRQNKIFRVHFVNVNHGDCAILEFPDYLKKGRRIARFAVVDFGAKLAVDKVKPTQYLQGLIDYRADGAKTLEYEIKFVCVTHPHDDHYKGLNHFMAEFANAESPLGNKVEMFMDCGFRTTSLTYNKALKRVAENDDITFSRVSAGSEFEIGDVRIEVLAPSIDLRNRFDTFGIGKNDASIVLRIQFRKGFLILAGDAEFASWGKLTEEFPRTSRITFAKDALGLADRNETAEQLKCQVLKLSHHGSKHGSTLEYLERLNPKHVIIPAGSQNWYKRNIPQWKGKFPHPLTEEILHVLNDEIERYITGVDGHAIFRFSGSARPKVSTFRTEPGVKSFGDELEQAMKNFKYKAS